MITITGASDDLIEIDGDINEEFNWYSEDSDSEGYVACSDGTLLRVNYDNDGLWRFVPIIEGAAEFSIKQGSVEHDTNDIVTLNGDIRWVALATHKAVRKSGAK